MSKKLKLSDILVTIVIALVFGIIYKLWGPVSTVLKPLGFQIDQLVYGMWFMAGPVAILITRKPGTALLAETAAAMGEVLFAGQGGIISFYYGLAQGLFVELAFLFFRYKRYDMLVTVLSGFGAALASLILDIGFGYIFELAGWNLALNIIFRFIGAGLISGVFAVVLVKALDATGVTSLVRPVSKDDYDVLDQ
ncbi:energy-coupling factor transport system substrate-specific component [Scopulibacillus darangshiensis]|uniref:Energy-coupling factor transport system substrate-specific component n=1 Tax=Scopulibacillus darangshiensis TaxID=442528 RepID=A0A4R2P9J8_9BACL|nr:ECF transporter S component [Scopulibacillus darangshiensis]TCP31587.1 energy-coupling factor transport system substrate-specific component [Scopulibacillus darangshiensis]